LNIHPSLLPSFPGVDTHRQALSAGVLIHGCTVHFVTPKLDSGPIIAQAAVRVVPGDTEETLAARVLAEEHRLYPMALRLICDGKARLDGAAVQHEFTWPGDVALLAPPSLQRA
ncbi:MAG TPA: formyltransferase family protein, partial [Beijerinckiaceae bacterium]|nr:formyltransferase family protein [Beijerinckiaceae bacterium]